MAAHQLQHKGLEFCETTIAELVIKRKITGLTPRAINQSGITTAPSLQKDKQQLKPTALQSTTVHTYAILFGVSQIGNQLKILAKARSQ